MKLQVQNMSIISPNEGVSSSYERRNNEKSKGDMQNKNAKCQSENETNDNPYTLPLLGSRVRAVQFISLFFPTDTILRWSWNQPQQLQLNCSKETTVWGTWLIRLPGFPHPSNESKTASLFFANADNIYPHFKMSYAA